MSVIFEKQMIPSFGIHDQDQQPVAMLTVLSINDQVGDCAAYRGVVPDWTHPHSLLCQDTLVEKVRLGGNKIEEEKAKSLFPEIESNELRYRR